MIHRKLLFALAVGLSIVLAGCSSSGGGGCTNSETGAPVPCPENIARHNRAVDEWNAAYRQVTAAKSTASEKMTAARSSRSQAAISAAIAANTAYETAARRALAAARRGLSAGVEGSQGDIDSQQRNLNQALSWQREIAALSDGSGTGGGGNNDGGSGSGGTEPENNAERITAGGTNREQIATWNAAVARQKAASDTANTATRAHNAAPSQALAQAAVSAIETALSLTEALVSLARNWRGGGAPDLAETQSLVRQWQNQLNNWRSAAARYGGSGGGGNNNGGSGGGSRTERPVNVDINTRQVSTRVQHLVGSITATQNFQITRDRPSFHSLSTLQNMFDRYVASSRRNSNLSSDGYRSWFGRNGVETFIESRNPSASDSFGRYGGFLTRSGTRNWARSPNGWNTGDFTEFLRDTFGRGQYSAYLTDAHFACREDASIDTSSFTWTASYCEGFTWGMSFGDRLDARPPASGTWRGAMTGDEVMSGAALTGDATVTYSSSRNSVDVAITNITDRRVHSGESQANGLGYEGPSRLGWNSMSVRSNGTFGESRNGGRSAIEGAFYGPEGQEAAGIFAHQFSGGCRRRCDPDEDGAIVGGFVAKR